MAENAIVGKLRSLLTVGINSECEVVYLLCELRKLFDKTPTRARPFALNMYCHWALHVDLRGTDTIMPFLQQIDAYVDGVLVGPEDVGASDRMVRDFIFLDTFKSQLHDFLAGYDLPTNLSDDDYEWNEFVKHYAGVIEDGSLVCEVKNHGLKHVKRVTLTKGKDAIDEFALVPFDMMWCIALQDGRFIDVDVNARPAREGVGSDDRLGHSSALVIHIASPLQGLASEPGFCRSATAPSEIGLTGSTCGIDRGSRWPVAVVSHSYYAACRRFWADSLGPSPDRRRAGSLVPRDESCVRRRSVPRRLV